MPNSCHATLHLQLESKSKAPTIRRIYEVRVKPEKSLPM